MNKVEQHLKDLAAGMKAAGFRPNLYMLFAEHGRPYNERAWNVSQHVQVMKMLDKMSFEPNACYMNCQRPFVIDTTGLLHYHEGYIMSDIVPVPVAHAWLTVGDLGTILDPTMDLLKKRHKDRRDEFVEYFGIEIAKKLVFRNQSLTQRYCRVTEHPDIAPYVFGLELE